MEVRPGYKQTEVGVIPEEWEALPARDIGAFKGGSCFPLTAQGETSGAYPFFKVSDMNNEGNETFMTTANHYISEDTRKRLGATAFPTDSIVFAKVGAAVFLERKKILRYPSCIDNNMAAFVLDKTRADVRYVHSLLLSRKLGALVSTTALPALNSKQLGEMALALPPLPEQRAIAAALSDVDALLDGLDRLITKKRDLKQAAMHQLLTGKTRLSGFEGEWDKIRLGDLLVFKNGLNKAKKFFGYGTPIVNYMDVFRCSFIKAENIEGRVSLTSQERSNFDVKKGDVFFTRTSETTNEIGIASVMLDEPNETVFSGFVLRARPLDGRLNDRFKSYCFGSAFVREQIISKASYTTRALTNGKILSEVLLPLPPLAEQSAIAAVLSDMDAELAVLHAQRDKTNALKQAMMQELLTGRIRLV